MKEITKINFAKYSIIVGLLAIAGLIALNIDLANHYLIASGKTRALFGIIELVSLPQKYFIGLLIIVEFILAIIAILKREKKLLLLFAIALGLLALY